MSESFAAAESMTVRPFASGLTQVIARVCGINDDCCEAYVMQQTSGQHVQALDDLEDRIRELEFDAAVLPEGELRQAVLKEIAHLRAHVAIERWANSRASCL
jgi:hypothetical protein